MLAVSHAFGYGMMDAGAMTELASRWRNVPEQHKCEIHGLIPRGYGSSLAERGCKLGWPCGVMYVS